MLRRNLLGLVVLPLLLSMGCTSPGTAKTCLPGSTDCGAGCVNLLDDQANCGTCANACTAGNVCSGGGCALTCGGGATLCGTKCADLQSDALHCGSCSNVCDPGMECVSGTCTPPVLIGSYAVDSGPNWTTNPTTFTCKEACALLFGGSATSYACSTVNTNVNWAAFASTWGTPGCQVVADTFKLNTGYNCGTVGCSTSSYVQDNCTLAPKTNFCWR
jgi:stigma-specific protein Stig1